jgi:bacterioferritin-associated ferredoxin
MDKNGCCKSDYLVCTCMGVMRSEIVDAIKNGADTYEQLQEMLGVGTGCSSCVPEVHEILDENK